MSEQRVRVEVDNHVATVGLIRADKHNALDRAMFEGILDAAEEVASTRGVRAVVLHGEGPSFCSGIDTSTLADGSVSPDFLLKREGGRSNVAQRAATDWIDVPVPVIAAIHGNCFGGGMQIALGADIRIAAPDAKLSIMEVKWGLVPDMGITSSLPRILPLDVAKELTFTGRVLSGAEAGELGLVTRVSDDPLAAAQELAAEIASKSPDAVRAAKQLYDKAWNAPVEAGLILETELQVGLIGSPNQVATLIAGMKKEQAEYEDPEPNGSEAARTVGFV